MSVRLDDSDLRAIRDAFGKVSAGWSGLSQQFAQFKSQLEQQALQLKSQLEQVASAWPGFVRRLVNRKIAVAKKLYEITENPLHVWNVYTMCRFTRQDIPEWVLKYFDRSAEQLFKLQGGAARKKVNGAAVAKALEFGAPAREFSNFAEHVEWAAIAAAVYIRIVEGDKETYAIEVVAKAKGISKSTAWRAWTKAKKHFPELVSQS